jgi:predicted phage terminase large subunit-like protein
MSYSESIIGTISDEEILAMGEKELDEYEELLKQEAAYNDFRSFIEYTMPRYDFNWHHEVLINRLNKLVHQKNQRILVFMPPRHGKSELVSRRFPAFYLGRHPAAKIIACSYSSTLSNIFNRDVQRIMEDEKYHEIFPDSMIPDAVFSRDHPDNKKHKKTTAMFEIIEHMGHLLSSGVGGTITGLGADLLIIDDPVKNEEEAMSITYRENTLNWYNSTAYTRLEGGANVVICQTRWHKGDLSGKLLEEMEQGGEQWEIISLPAIAGKVLNPHDIRKKGEPLWEGKYDLDRLEIIKRQVGSRVWSSLYQQSPIIEGGNIVKEDWFRYYTQLPFDVTKWREAHTVTSWDLSFKSTGKSYVVGVVIAKHNQSYYLLDIYRRKADIVETQRAIKKMSESHPYCRSVLIEDKANGPAVLALLKNQVPNLIPVQVAAAKDERLHSISPVIESGNFYLPANHPLSKTIVEEMCSFPNAENDDIVDAISQAINRFMEMKGLRHLRAITKW